MTDAPQLDAETAKRVKYVVLDVDGVMTDGGVYLGDVDGRRLEFKKYDIQDGLGILMLRWAGIRVGVITGRVSESVALRAAELKVDDLVQDDQARKLPALRKLCLKHGIGLEEVAFVGDDLPDLGVLREVGLPVVVANASEDAVKSARIHLTRAGGAGAIREFCEMLLRARGEWEPLVERYVKSRSEGTVK
ncbi:MAG: HAD hydrolase family protein [Gemmatimonadaceae bacterium]|nr:HAD hydrolase family protein [Gemmatimonadaceae bacterium]